MIRTGQTLVNAVTGESLTFVRTAADTNGELVEVECVVQPAASWPRRTCTRSRRSASRSVEGELA